MRLVQTFGLATAALATLAATPAMAQDPRPLTVEDSVECMIATMPFLLAATATNPNDVERFDEIGTFWARKGDSFGEASDAEMAMIEGRFDTIIGEFDTLESDADIPAFLAPYQATFDKCEVMRQSLADPSTVTK